MKNHRLTVKEVVQITVISALIVLGIVCVCGTINCGFHFVDDGETIVTYYKKTVEQKSFWEIFRFYQERDILLKYRFRPLYILQRAAENYFWDMNLTAMSMAQAIEIIVAMVLCYCCGRKISLTKWQSVLVMFFITVGPQSAVWWKLGPQETEGMWMFPLIALLFLNYCESGKKIYNIFTLFFCFAASLYKESYILMLPSMGLIYLIKAQKDEGIKGEDVTWSHFWFFIRRQWINVLCLFINFVLVIYIWLFKVGGNNVSYAGFSTDIRIYDYLLVQFNNLRMPLRVGSYAVFALIAVICMWKYRREVLKYKLEMLLVLYTIIIQQIVHSRTGLEERYVFPWIIGVCGLFVILVFKMNVLEGKRKIIYYAGLYGLIIYSFLLVIREANYFAYRGECIENLWEAVEESADGDTIILTAFYPYLESDETNYEWFKLRGYHNVYHLTAEGEYKIFDKEETVGFEEVDMVLFYHPSDRHYIDEPALDLSNFDIVEFGTVRMALRKG